MRSRTVAIIPARYDSTRLPGKPLIEIAGRPMILHVIERTAQATLIDRVIVATDDDRVCRVVREAGWAAHLTSPTHKTGTDRLAEVAAELKDEIIVNVQGDEPLIDPLTIDAAIRPLIKDHSLVMSTACEPINSVADVLDPSVVKVIVDTQGFALYFSRSPIPFPRDKVLAHGSIKNALEANKTLLSSFTKHIGLYAYRREFLLRYSTLAPTPLEKLESLEQLRALEYGYRIKVIPVINRSIGVDTPEDLKRVRHLMAEKEFTP